MRYIIQIMLITMSVSCTEKEMDTKKVAENFINDILEGSTEFHDLDRQYFESVTLTEDESKRRKELQDQGISTLSKVLKEGFKVETYKDAASRLTDLYEIIGGDEDNVCVIISSIDQQTFFIHFNNENKIKSINPMISGNKIIGWY